MKHIRCHVTSGHHTLCTHLALIMYAAYNIKWKFLSWSKTITFLWLLWYFLEPLQLYSMMMWYVHCSIILCCSLLYYSPAFPSEEQAIKFRNMRRSLMEYTTFDWKKLPRAEERRLSEKPFDKPQVITTRFRWKALCFIRRALFLNIALRKHRSYCKLYLCQNCNVMYVHMRWSISSVFVS